MSTLTAFGNKHTFTLSVTHFWCVGILVVHLPLLLMDYYEITKIFD